MQKTLRVSGIASPRGLIALALGEFWDRFGFYGTLTLLLFYVVNTFSWTERHAYLLWGDYSTLAFMTPVVGGYIADKWFGFVKTSLLGAVLMSLGQGLLLLSTCKIEYALFLGLSLHVVGIGLFKGNTSSLVGTLYEKEAPARDTGYTLFSMWMIAGAMLGPLLYGFLSQTLGWAAAFALSALGILGNSVWMLWHKRYWSFKTLPQPTMGDTRIFGVRVSFFIYVGLALGILSIAVLMRYARLGQIVLLIISLGLFCGFTFSVLRQAKESRERWCIVILLLLAVPNIVYMAASLQGNGSLIAFTATHVNMTLAGFHIPAASVSSLEGLFSIALAPLFAYLWKKHAILSYHKITIGMGACLLAFLVFFSLSFLPFDARVEAWIGLLVGNLLLGIACILIIPTVMAMLSQYAPGDTLGTLMGLLFLTNALGCLLGADMAHWGLSTSQHYSVMFIEIAGVVFVATFITAALTPLVIAKLKEPKDDKHEK